MKASIIVQARTGSKRLPRKILLKVLDKSILEHLIERLKRAKAADRIIIATTTAREDNEIAALARKLNVEACRGSVDDVLDRFYQAARQLSLKHIVRITADCPLIDPEVIDSVISLYFSSRADYCSNVLERTFPDGEDVEVFSFDALERAWNEAKLTSEREHVTTYIRKHQEKFKLENLNNISNISEKRWTLDREEDYRFIKALYEGIYSRKPDFGMDDIISFLEQHPELEKINKNIMRGEGYVKSLREDKII